MYNNEGDKLKLFHGTDYEKALMIKDEGFSIKISDEHWLGNGIYFFADYSLAKWWTTKPTQKFGGQIKERAIIECSLKEDISILDLRNLDQYKKFCDEFQNRFIIWLMENSKNKFLTSSVVRCTYCDTLHNLYRYDAIIGNFHLPEQPYQPQIKNSLFTQFAIQYTELQVCVFNKDAIKIELIEKVGDNI